MDLEMEELKNKRVVLLFGAGAARPWGGPSTQDVTDLILGRIEGDKACHTDPKVINLIYNFLYYKYSQSSSDVRINFEDIISVIEELILFYYKEEKGSNLILPHFFDLKSDFRDDLESCFSNEKSVFENLISTLNEVLLSITDIVYRYSKWILPKKEEIESIKSKDRVSLNELFNSWVLKICSNNTVIRSYTLNYDRLFKILLEDSLNKSLNNSEANEVFEGLGGVLYESNVKNIFFDRNCNCHFNLHGSIYWHVNKYSPLNSFEDHHFNFREFPDVPGSSGPIISELEKGRPFVFSNIIAGYKKSQRSFITPFKQMHASFEMDCLNGDISYIIGYSFSDSHINAAIKTSISHNKKMKLIIIDPSFKDENLVSNMEFLLNIFPSLIDIKKLVNDSNKKGVIPKEFMEGRLIIYPLTFEDYLKFENIIK